MRSETFVLLSALLCTSTFAVQAEDTALDELMASYWAEYLEASPLAATVFGAEGARDTLDDLSPKARRARRNRLGAYEDHLGAVETHKLSDDGREQFNAFSWMLRQEAANLDQNTSLLTFNTLRGWQSMLPQILLSQPYVTQQHYEDLLKRYRQIERYARQNVDLLEEAIRAGYTQPCDTLEGYSATISGYIADDPATSVYAFPFDNMPATIPEADQQRLRDEAHALIRNVINPAYRSYAEFFEESYLPACRKQAGLWSLPGGRDAYDQLIRFYTSLETDAETVHELGLSEVARIQGEMQLVMQQVGFEGTLKAFLEYMANDTSLYPRDEQSYLNYIAWVTKSIDGLLPLYFSRLPTIPYGIKVVPAQTAPKTTTAYYQPGAENGTRAGNYFVNTYDLPSRPLYEIPALSLHEAVPGHHLQISMQQENKRLPAWRRNYYFHAFGEGWGLYAEKLGIEMGLYTTPYEHFGRLIYEIWRAARLVVDPGIHAKGWTRQQAIDYMLANTGLTEANIIAEVDRYITYPAQATAYKHGELKILELRARAEAALGDDFDLREFHTALLEGGSMPLVVLDARVDRWIGTVSNG
ncbi:MAG: DUF885 domain-containing protein, partial [Kiritimatiellia bacterium]|nr:DUF885 domain-containing protein [Kiritimatiellia bacterium]